MHSPDPSDTAKPKASIIVRTRNEERWIGPCLTEVFNQKFTDFEVIVVDNQSTDGTLAKLKQFPVKIVAVEEYRPGASLNEGIRASRGEYLVILSGHCIPASSDWLGNLLANLEEEKVAGAYGRQLPMSFSSPQTKRDLLITFGLDRRVHSRDSFFHNANSAIRRDVWEKVPFDEQVTNIEDRIWASKVLESGYHTVYDPEAAVYHHHGIHHDNDRTRMMNTVRVIKKISKDVHAEFGKFDPEKTKIVCLIPHMGTLLKYGDEPLLRFAIDCSVRNRYIDQTIVLTDNAEAAEFARACGAQAPFLRDPEQSREYVDLSMVYSYYLGKLEDTGVFADLVVSMEPTYVWRPPNLIEDLISLLLSGGYDSVVPVVKEYGLAWLEQNGAITRVDAGNFPRPVKPPMLISAKGLGYVTHTEFIRSGNLVGDNCGIYTVDKKFASVQISSEEDVLAWGHFLENYSKKKL